jgi:hypothetical protein
VREWTILVRASLTHTFPGSFPEVAAWMSVSPTRRATSGFTKAAVGGI